MKDTEHDINAEFSFDIDLAEIAREALAPRMAEIRLQERERILALVREALEVFSNRDAETQLALKVLQFQIERGA